MIEIFDGNQIRMSRKRGSGVIRPESMWTDRWFPARPDPLRWVKQCSTSGCLRRAIFVLVRREETEEKNVTRRFCEACVKRLPKALQPGKALA